MIEGKKERGKGESSSKTFPLSITFQPRDANKSIDFAGRYSYFSLEISFSSSHNLFLPFPVPASPCPNLVLLLETWLEVIETEVEFPTRCIQSRYGLRLVMYQFALYISTYLSERSLSLIRNLGRVFSLKTQVEESIDGNMEKKCKGGPEREEGEIRRRIRGGWMRAGESEEEKDAKGSN